MAVTLLRVLVLGVIAATAAADDLPVTWSSLSTVLSCVVPGEDALMQRRPPPLIASDDRTRHRSYVWYKDHEEILQATSSGTLEVSQRKDGSSEGVYQCGIRHHGLVLGYPINLKFAYIEDHFSTVPENRTVRVGQPFVLTCDVSSGPRATITWIKGEEVIYENERYHFLDSKHQLLILDAKDRDSGVYWCKATNPVLKKTRISSPALVQVEREEGRTGLSFLPLQETTTIYVNKGDRVVLACPVVGWPKPEMLWKLIPSVGRTAELEPVNQVLVLQSMQEDLEGVITCSVDGRTDLIKTFNVTILEPVNITLPPVSKQVFRASTVRFNCTATGKPSPTVSWYRDGHPLDVSGRKIVLPSADGRRRELLIRSVTSEDAGIYQCLANNGFTGTSAWSRLDVAGERVAAPEGVRCEAVGPAKVRVYWDKMNATVVAYTVHSGVYEGKSYAREPLTTTEEIITLPEPLTPYIFQVTAFILDQNNKTIVSDLSKPVTCQGQGVPVKITRMSDQEVVVSWYQFAESEAGRGVRGWMLQYKTQPDNVIHNITFDDSVRNYILHASPGTEVRVLGWRVDEMEGDMSAVPWQRTDLDKVRDGNITAIPENVQVISFGSREMTVTWSCAEAEASLDSYTFLVCVTNNIDDDENCVDSKINKATIDNLEPDSEYEVRVQARVAGQRVGGKFSEPIHVSTQAEGLQRFVDLKHKYINSTTIRVSWNSVPDKYVVHYTNDVKMPKDQWATVETVGNTVLLTGLDLKKEVYVMVTGYETEGHSRIMTIPVQVPDVKELQYSVSGSGVRVWWRGRGSRVVHYSQNLTQPLETWTAITAAGNSVTISGLDPSLPTYVTVAAPGPNQKPQVLTIEPHPQDNSTLYLGLGVVGGVLLLLVLVIATICLWRNRKRFLTPDRSRRRNISTTDGHGESSELQAL